MQELLPCLLPSLEEGRLLVQSATVAVRSGTLPVLALNLLELLRGVDTAGAHLVVEVLVPRLGRPFSIFVCLDGLSDWHLSVHSYTCGGVGHLSRDCVQGSKCYNCSGVVSITVHSAVVGRSTCCFPGAH